MLQQQPEDDTLMDSFFPGTDDAFFDTPMEA